MTWLTALDAAASGASVANTWMDAISNNVANVNTIRPAGQAPFRAQLVLAQARPGNDGVEVAGVAAQAGTPDRVYDPSNPLADAAGYVTKPVVNLTDEMTNLIVAQRLYALNLSVHAQATQTYEQALTIGKSS